jgi:hypothetical protein
VSKRVNRRVTDSQGFEVTQEGYNAMVRAVANLSALVVYLEDKLDEFTQSEIPAPTPIPPAGSRAPESGQTAQVELE